MPNVTTLNVNGKKLRVDVDSQTPLLYVLRDHLNLTGTKYGCGEAKCGACTVLVEGQQMRSCVTPPSSAERIERESEVSPSTPARSHSCRASGRDHRLALQHVHADRLLHVHVRPSLHRGDGV